MQSLAVTGRGAVAPAGRAERVVFRTLRRSKPHSVHEPRPGRSPLIPDSTRRSQHSRHHRPLAYASPAARAGPARLGQEYERSTSRFRVGRQRVSTEHRERSIIDCTTTKSTTR